MNSVYGEPAFDENGVPMVLSWSVADVGLWVRDVLQYPEYEECFVKNFINGQKLIYIDASILPRIGVTNFLHIMDIASKVRVLLGIEDPFWNRSITLPSRDPVGHFLERKSITGNNADRLTFREHLRYLSMFSEHK
uniref:Sterile alpha motif domain-containing protein 15 n=1 Tax=Hydra vulgaris TaxID=6087 RepID=T2M423_HYDVU